MAAVDSSLFFSGVPIRSNCDLYLGLYVPKRALIRLSVRRVATLTRPGLYADGDGLYLQVTSGGKSWIFRYMRHGDAHKLGLGSFGAVSLADARHAAREMRSTLAKGIDPLAERNRRRMAQRLADSSAVTFSDCCAAYIDAHEASWRNPKHRGQWASTLATYVEPSIGRAPVRDIDTPLVLRVLEPIWRTKTETATRVRQRMEAVLDWARVRGYRAGENPARWRGHLDKLLPKPAKLKKIRHHPALPFAEIHDFVVQLRALDGVGARALEFVILNAARTNEAIGARWDEIDLKNALWSIPGERMKAGRDHTVPLTPRAATILREMRRLGGNWCFPGLRDGKPISNMAMLETLKRMGRSDLTVHGFRSTFRDWCAEQTSYPQHVAEMALAHQIRNAAEAAYRRGDLLEKRRRLMADWAKYIETPMSKSTLTRIRGRG